DQRSDGPTAPFTTSANVIARPAPTFSIPLLLSECVVLLRTYTPFRTNRELFISRLSGVTAALLPTTLTSPAHPTPPPNTEMISAQNHTRSAQSQTPPCAAPVACRRSTRSSE